MPYIVLLAVNTHTAIMSSTEDLATSPSKNMDQYSEEINSTHTLVLKPGIEQFTPSNSPSRRRKIEKVSFSPEVANFDEIPNDIDMNKFLYNMLTSIKQDTMSNQTDVENLKTAVSDIQENSQKESQTIHKLQIDNHNLALSNKIILGRLIRTETKMDQMAAQITDLTTRSMRDNLIIKTSGQKYRAIKNEDTSAKFREFIRDELKVPDTDRMQITRAHRMGRGNEKYNSMMIAKLPYASDQQKIFDNISVLKGTELVITKQYPNVVEERRQFAWKAFKDAKAKGVKANFDSTGHLYINNEHMHQYDAMTIPPVSAAVAAAGPVNILWGRSDIEFVNEHALQAVIFKATDADGISEARDKLLADSEMIAGATHIPYAFRFASGAENYDSDHDHFAGTNILAAMRKLKITDAVAFVLHYEPPAPISMADKRGCIESIVKAAMTNFVIE